MAEKSLLKEVLKYVPVYPQAPMDMKYHYYDENEVLKVNEGLFTLATSLQDVKDYLADCEGKIIGVDTETTGLTYGSDVIVGYSVSKDIYSGIYVPIRHKIVRQDEEEIPITDEEGNALKTKTGKARVKKQKKETYFDNPLNLPAKEALDILYDTMLKAKLNIFHNSEFDLTMIRQEGYDVMKCPTFDTMVLTYLYDSENKEWNKLKEASKIVLGRHPMKFYEALGTEKNFQTVDLIKATPYAASDSANCLGLFLKLYPKVVELLKKCPNRRTLAGEHYNPLKADNKLIRAFTDYYQHVDLKVNRQAAIDYKMSVQDGLAKVEETIFSYFQKGMFNLSPSSKEFKNTMKEFHIETGAKTNTGAVSYGKAGIAEMDRQLRGLREILAGFKYIDFVDGSLNKRASANELRLANYISIYAKDFFKISETANTMKLKTLENISMDKMMFFEELKLLYKREKKKLTVLTAIQQRSSLKKALESYIAKLTEVDTCHMRYRLQGTASGRLSSGNGSKTETRKNHYFIDLNAQNLTKPHSAYYKAYKSDKPGNILGWDFEMVPEEFYREHGEEFLIVEGSDPKANIRNCLVAPEGRYLASLDYSAQEYRVVAILSHDHKMINNFLNGIDPHTATAYDIWGKDHYDRQKRKKAKACIGDDVYLVTNNGYKKAKDLDVNNDLVYDFNGEPQHWAKTEEYGDMIEVTYSNGITETYTPNHRVKIWNGEEIVWKEVQELTEEDNVIQYVGNYHVGDRGPVWEDYSHVYEANTSQYSASRFDVNTNEFAYLAGIYMGDGYITRKSTSTVTNKPAGVQFCVEPDSLETVLGYIERLGLIANKPVLIGKGKKIYKVNVTNRAFAALMDDYCGSTKNKGVNPKVFQIWSKERLKYFVAGMLDTDGYEKAHNVFFSTTLQSIATTMAMSCAAVGIKISLAHRTAKYKGEPYPWLEIVLYDIPVELPLLNTTKFKDLQSNQKRNSKLGSWNITNEFARATRAHYIDWGDKYTSKYYTAWSNVVAGHSLITPNMAKLTREKLPDFPIRENMAPVSVVSKKWLKDSHINVLQTTNHLYASVGAGSHNCNFLMAYCGGAFTLSKNLDIPLQEAEHIISMYEKAYFECIAWKKNSIADCLNKQDAVAYNAVGRPRQFKSRLSSSFQLLDASYREKVAPGVPAKDLIRISNGMKSAVDRRIVSHLVQSICGDICRSDLIRLYDRFFKNRDPHIDFYSTVHDEINFAIDKDYIIDYVREIDDIMTIRDLHPKLPIITSIDLGYTLGVLFPFEWTDNTRTMLQPQRA